VKVDRELVSRVLLDVATAQDLESIGVDNVVAIKSDPENLVVRKGGGSMKRAPKTLDPERRIVSLEVSNDLKDRSGDRVRTKGIDLSEFKLNPVHLFGHRDDSPEFAMGPVLKATKGRDVKPDRTTLVHDVEFFDFDVNPKAAMVFEMQQRGVYLASSIRFRPIKANRPKTQREREKLGIGEFGVDFEGVYLMESSTVGIPDNQNAIAKALDQFAEDGTYSWAQIKHLQDSLKPDTRTVFQVGAPVEINDQLTDEASDLLERVKAAAYEGTKKALQEHRTGTGADERGEGRGDTPEEPAQDPVDAAEAVDPLDAFKGLSESLQKALAEMQSSKNEESQ
jgi:hypothetical protein